MPLTLYVDRPSPLHRLHPVAKLGALAGLFVAVFLPEHPMALAPWSLLVAVLCLWSGAWVSVRRLRWLFLLIFLFTLLIWAFSYREGPPVPLVGVLGVRRDGLLFGLGTALKLVTFLGLGVLFLSTTKIEEFTYALNCVGVPYRVGFTMTLAFRLVPVFLDSALAVVQAQRCRGLDFRRGSLLVRLRRYVPVLVPVFMGALRRADQMAMALEMRGFSSTARPRTSLLAAPMRARDVAALALTLGLVAVQMTLWLLGVGAVVAGG